MLKEKIGQMLMMGFQGTELRPDDVIVRAILARQVGGVILFARNIRSPSQLKQLTRQLNDYAADAGLAPLLISLDYEGGRVRRLDEAVGFPPALSAQALGLLSDKQLQTHAERMADTLLQAGINLNFAPNVDVNVNANNPVIGKLERSFSYDPDKVAQCAAIVARAHHDRGILCAYKHFPGHGSSTGDTHTDFVDVTDTWLVDELKPYKQLIQQADQMTLVMTSHVVHRGLDATGYPASLSRAMTKDLLREQLGFQGVVVTDDMQMKAIVDHYGLAEAVRCAVNATADLLIFGNQLSMTLQDPQAVIELIHADVLMNAIPVAVIDTAYKRLMKIRKRIKSNPEYAQSIPPIP